MKNTSYMNDNVENYAIYLINNGLKKGDKVRENFGAFQKSNIIYQVEEITEEKIILTCIDVIKPRMDQKVNKLIGSKKEIIINDCGSFPRFILF